jgi:drug/metabolite transporter (DMT)-like permease
MAGGLVLISRGGVASFDAQYLPGYAAALACAVIWATYSVANRAYSDVPSDSVGGFCAVTAALAALCHFAFETTVVPQGAEWLAILALGLGPLGLAFFVWDHACKHGNLRSLGILSYAVPLMSNGLLIVFGRADLTWSVGLAALLIVGGAAVGAGDLFQLRRSS